MTDHEQPDSAQTADQKYIPIGSFAKWANMAVRRDAWEHTANDRERSKDPSKGIPEAIRSRAINTILRIAAAKTGEVEDLYRLTRGQTLSIGRDDPMWRTKVSETSSSATGHIDAQLETYEYLRRIARATSSEAIGSAWIRDLHAMVTQHQLTYRVETAVGPQMHELPRGSYKIEPNHVLLRDGTVHAYAPVTDTVAEMNRLSDELNSDLFKAAHPVLQASYAHWALTHIHPFADGNGRVARAVASLYLLRVYDVPVLIFPDRKYPYFNALEEADEGRPGPFVSYIERRSLDTFAWLSELEVEYANPPLTAEILVLNNLVASLSGVQLENRDTAAIRVRDRLVGILTEIREKELGSFAGEIVWSNEIRDLFPPNSFREVSLQQSTVAPSKVANDYSNYAGGFSWIFRLAEPARVILPLRFHVTVSIDEMAPTAVCVDTSATPLAPIRLALDDLSPTLSEAVEFRLETFARRAVANAIQVIQRSIETALVSQVRAERPRSEPDSPEILGTPAATDLTPGSTPTTIEMPEA